MARRPGPAVLVVALLLAIGLLAAPSAHAGAAYDEVLKDYQPDGKIDPCAHSEETLRDAANQVPANIAQTAPDLPVALGKAIDRRAAGRCKGKGAATPPAKTTPTKPPKASTNPPTKTAPATPPKGSTTPPATTTPGGTTPAPTTTDPSGTGRPAAAGTPTEDRSSDAGSLLPWVLGALAALLVLTALAIGLGRWLGWDSGRLAGVRHAFAEAGFRAGGTWADFRDWVRVGR